MLTRRNFVMGAGAAAAVAGLADGAQAGVAFQAWHDRTQADHTAQVNKWLAAGYSTASLSSYGPLNDTRYAAIMIKRMLYVPEQHIIGYTLNDMVTARIDMQAKDFYPVLVSANGAGADARYTIAFRKGAKSSFMLPDLSGPDMQTQNLTQMLAGKVLVSADAYGNAKNVRYIAVWADDPNSTGWACNSGATNDGLNDDPARTLEIFDAQTSQGARLAQIVPTPTGGYLTMYSDTRVGEWVAQGEMSSADYQAAFNTYTAKGLIPIRVMAKSTPAGNKFAAVFATSDQIVPRKISFSTTTPANQAVDDVLRQVMTDGDVRGMSVAITRGPRLVYARGVSYGEPDYPQILPETPFRQASISKVFCAVALYALLQKDHDFKADPLMDGPLSRKMQDILNVQPPAGMKQDANWKNITLRHLLESESGINFGTPWASRQAVTAASAQLPANATQFLSWASVQTLTGTPGDHANCVYGNDGYMILAEVVRTLAGTTDLAQALQKLVCKPLGMKHTRGSRTTVGDQPADEARYHNRIFSVNDKKEPQLVPLSLVPSCMYPDQRLAPYQYGNLEYETEQGCGGLSVAAIDIARIIAMFNTGGPYPVLSEAAMSAMLTNSHNAGLVASGPNPKEVHGWHGFDSVRSWGGNWRAQKGGWLPSHECLVDFVTGGGCGVIMQVNGNKRKESTFMIGAAATDWLGKLYDIANNGKWDDSVDLFHTTYGMDTLVPSLPGLIKPITPKWPPLAVETGGASLTGEIAGAIKGAAPHTAPAPRPSAPRRAAGPLTLSRPVTPLLRPRGT